MATERRPTLIKPDEVHCRLGGQTRGRIETSWFERRKAKLAIASRQLGEEHYVEHREKPLLGELVEFIASGPTWALDVKREGPIVTLRATIGTTDPADAAPGTAQGDLASSKPDNLGRGADSPESAERDISLWICG